MFNIEVINNNLKISLAVNDNGNIFYDYFGDLNVNFLKNSRTKVDSHIIEIESRGLNHGGNHCEKFLMSPYGVNSKYVSHNIKETNNTKVLEVVNTKIFLVLLFS